MPDGPVIVSPDRTFNSFKREVIVKKPHLFKIETLSTIQRLFPEGTNPFFGGFGNRPTDSLAYRAISIDLFKIFIVNPKGNVSHWSNLEVNSYTQLKQISNDVFPVVQNK